MLIIRVLGSQRLSLAVGEFDSPTRLGKVGSHSYFENYYCLIPSPVCPGACFEPVTTTNSSFAQELRRTGSLYSNLTCSAASRSAPTSSQSPEERSLENARAGGEQPARRVEMLAEVEGGSRFSLFVNLAAERARRRR